MQNSNDPQLNRSQSVDMMRSNSLKYSEQEEINQKESNDEEINSTSYNVWVYILFLIIIGILWLCGRNQNWGDDVNGLVLFTLILYIASPVIIAALWVLVLKNIISKNTTATIKFIISLIQVVWYIYCVVT